MSTRSSWLDVWKGVATAVAGRPRCIKRQVGAVVVSSDNRDHWVGYNGPPAGLWPPQDERERDCGQFCPQGSQIRLVAFGPRNQPDPECVALHAEQNARNAVTDPARLVGGLWVVTAAPCWKCALTIASTKPAVLCCPPYEDDRLAQGILVSGMLAEAGVQIIPWD